MEDMLADIAMAPRLDASVKTEAAAELSVAEEGRKRTDEQEGGPVYEEEADIEEEALVAQVEESIRQAGGGGRALHAFRITDAAQKKAARRLVGEKALRAAVDIRPFQKAKKEANRKALAASKRGDMAEVTKWLNLELMHHRTIREAMRARDLRERIIRRYGTRALLTALEEGEHRARVENEYAEAVKAIATFVGLTKSRRLRPQTESEVIPFPTYEAGSNVAEFLPDNLMNNYGKTYIDESGNKRVDSGAVQLARAYADHVRWLASRLIPEMADKKQVEHSGHLGMDVLFSEAAEDDDE